MSAPPDVEKTLDAVSGEGVPILWHSNAPWAGTGYGTQTGLFGPLLGERLGYRVAFSAFYGLRGSRIGWHSRAGQPYIVYPGSKDPYGNDVVGAHAKHWFAGIGGMVLTLTDPWVLSPGVCARLPLVSWIPIDHDPIIPLTHQWIGQTQCVPLAMSRFGERVMVDAGWEPLYAPHGFDGEIFFPGDRTAARKMLNIPQSAFVVGMVAANQGVPSRKGFSEAVQAFARFQKIVPEARLYLHTMLENADGENLPELCDSLGVRPMSSDQYGMALGSPAGHVSALMNSFDVLLNPSYGEGFGIPIIEAQACGTPCIVTDFSAMPEVAPVGVGNWNVSGRRRWSNFDSWQLCPDVDEIVYALQVAYEESDEERLARRQGVYEHAQQYRAEEVTDEFFKPALEEAAHRLSWRDSRMMTVTR